MLLLRWNDNNAMLQCVENFDLAYMFGDKMWIFLPKTSEPVYQYSMHNESLIGKEIMT